MQESVREEKSSDVYRVVVMSYGFAILRSLLLGVGGSLPRSSTPYLAELLHTCACLSMIYKSMLNPYVVLTKYPDEARQWIGQLFAEVRCLPSALTFILTADQPGFPNARLDQTSKERFLKTAMTCRTLKRMRTVVEDFSILARGLQGTAYGANSSLS